MIIFDKDRIVRCPFCKELYKVNPNPEIPGGDACPSCEREAESNTKRGNKWEWRTK